MERSTILTLLLMGFNGSFMVALFGSYPLVNKHDWENSLFRLDHGFNSQLWVYQRVYLGMCHAQDLRVIHCRKQNVLRFMARTLCWSHWHRSMAVMMYEGFELNLWYSGRKPAPVDGWFIMIYHDLSHVYPIIYFWFQPSRVVKRISSINSEMIKVPVDGCSSMIHQDPLVI